ncbi:MAG: hypothetical protein MI741_16110 [Rhodospirillales bacterium]|nr:hypothetical protein [Rhodospirillales bacterium]
MGTIPAFDNSGLLPPGDHEVSIEQLRDSHLVNGEGRSEWDASWRASLADNLSVLVGQLWEVGVTRIFVNGSFAEDKPHPNDIDGYFECELAYLANGALQRDLNDIDPHQV